MNTFNSDELQHSSWDVFPVFMADFIKDFDCRDIEPILRAILIDAEIDCIVKAQKLTGIYRLFWTMRAKKKEVVEKFLEGLQDSRELCYGFLTTAIQSECHDPSPNTNNYIQSVDRLYNDNQQFSKYNVLRFDAYLRLQKAILELKPSKNVVVEGVLGAGKQWLVLDVCSSYIVQRKMDFKIFWLNVQSCCTPESLLQKLQVFLYQISPNMRTNCDQKVDTRIEMVKTELKGILKEQAYKNCVLVLLNVENKETFKAFNVGCKIVLTTRHKSVANFLSPTTTTHVTLQDALTPFETQALFSKYLGENRQQLDPLIASLITDQNTNPLLLCIIAKMIRDGRCTIDNWKQIESNKLTTIIEKSLSVLDSDQRRLYKVLSIFPDTAHIPIALLGLVWSVDDPLSIVLIFEKYSLVEYHRNTLTITRPAIYTMLKHSVTNEAELSQQIVDHYDIHRLFDQSNEMTLSHLDSYFYTHIGHHLSKLSNENDRLELFRKIFLDFRFLDQKIRNDTTPWDARGSVLHTLQLLELYRSLIVSGEQRYDNLLSALLDFLTSVEEKLIMSKFTCLLQIALMADQGEVCELALRQAQRYPDYVWFTERGRFHQHRRIINLGKDQVQHAIYLDNDFCLIALRTKQLLLTDVSLGGDTSYMLSDASDSSDPSDIIEMRVFNKQMHLLTLHSNGSLKLWSLGGLLRLSQFAHASTDSAQLINNVVKYEDRKISAFFLDEKKTDENNTRIQLHVAYSNGNICECDWENKEEKFKRSSTPILRINTDPTDIVRCFSIVFNRFYVLCTVKCKLTVWSLICSAKVTELTYNDEALAMEKYIERLEDGSQCTVLLLIYKSGVKRLKFKLTDQRTIAEVQSEPLPLLENSETLLTCGRLSKDGRYLVLGTLEGLIVYDINSSNIVLRSNVSERIICLDVYDLNGPIFKYIVLCGAAGKNFLHMHTLRNVPGIDNDVITWVHNAKDNYAQTRDTHVYLRPLLKKSNDNTLFSVDSNSIIHRIQTRDGPNTTGYWSTLTTPPTEKNNRITAIYASNNNTMYAGYNNGIVYNISDNKKLSQEHICDPIDYLKVYSSILVASSRQARTTLFCLLRTVETENPTWSVVLPKYTMYARVFNEHFLLLFSDCGVSVYYVDSSCPSQQQVFEEPDYQLVGFDLKQDLLFLAFSDATNSNLNKCHVYKLSTTGDKLNYQQINSENISLIGINYLTVSNDAAMLFLSFKSGIRIYKYTDLRLKHIYTIEQGHKPCSEIKLRYSPSAQILVSCGEQLCFWNVRHMLNNQEEVDGSPCSSISVDDIIGNVNQPLQRTDRNCAADNKVHLWMDKRGNATFPELLASIKFVGNRASNFYTSDDFTQFYVIDDEGVFYHLKALEHSSIPKDDDDDDDCINVVGNLHSLPSSLPINKPHTNDTLLYVMPVIGFILCYLVKCVSDFFF